MFKISATLLALSVAALAYAANERLPTLFMQLNITLGLAAITLRLWWSKQREEEQSALLWGKYQTGNSKKVPHYHDL